MSWFKRKDKPQSPDPGEEKTVRTEGLFVKCPGCEQMLFKRDVDENLGVCPKCNYHNRIDSRERLRLTFDNEKWIEHDAGLSSNDPLEFVDTKSYADRLRCMQKNSGMLDAVIIAQGEVGGHPAIVCAMELAFVGGSLGSVVGEKITRALERAVRTHSPVIIYSA